MNEQGDLRKMEARLTNGGQVEYTLPLGEGCRIPLKPLLGKRLSLVWRKVIHCIHCGRETRKSFNQGYCFPCVRRLARCDSCIVKPELCHYHLGTCREPQWAALNCFQPHVIYLANSSALKVGITRQTQMPTRWIDQGATQALPILRVQNRRLAGEVEVVLKHYVSDRTQWQRMLKGEAASLDLVAEWQRLRTMTVDRLRALPEVEWLQETPLVIHYPVRRYPEKVRAFNFDKHSQVEGTLEGIKGQYLIFDSGVLNVRKFAGYRVMVNA